MTTLNRGAPRESPRRCLLLYQVHILPIAHVGFPPPFLPSSTTSIAFCYTQERQTKPFLCPIFLSFYRIFAVHSTSGSVGPRKNNKLQKETTPPTKPLKSQQIEALNLDHTVVKTFSNLLNSYVDLSTSHLAAACTDRHANPCKQDSPPVRRSPLLSRFWRSIGLSPDPVKAET